MNQLSKRVLLSGLLIALLAASLYLRRDILTSGGGGVSVPTERPSETVAATETVARVFDGERALQHVAAQVDFGPRPTGSEAHAQTGDYIIAQIEQAGWRAEAQGFTYQGVDARNIIARGTGSLLDEPVIIIGAHYDTRLRADQDATNPEQPVLGANDGASGAAVLLELAFVLDLDTIGADVWLVFFDAEDNGRLDGWDWIVGSRYFVENLAIDPLFAVIVDMVGDADQQLHYERSSDAALRQQIWSVANDLGYGDAFIPTPKYSMLDDHTPFLEIGIVAVDIIDFDYPYWHTGEDTLDKVSAASLERVGRTLQVLLQEGGWKQLNQG